MNMNSALEAALWSIAIPGFGQIINKKYFKGLILIVLEVLINVQSGLNTVIIYSFQGRTLEAMNLADYQWLMFYPCIYLFAIWDAYRDGGGDKVPLLYLPFAISAYSGTIGVVFSDTLMINNIFLGPFWAMLCFALTGLGLGFIIRLVALNCLK